ncbi:MAG: helix-turn-helix domain-containing protein [Solirubrobacteraceae bacterium]
MSCHADVLRESRRRAGLTQADLALRLGVSQAAIAKLERSSSNPTVSTLARVLGASGHSLTIGSRPSWSNRATCGADASLIRKHLELTPAQRLDALEEMHVTARALSNAGRRAGGAGA